MEILTLKRCDAETIYSTLVKWLKKNGVQCRKMVEMGFDGALTFAGKHLGVQARLKKHIQSSFTATVLSSGGSRGVRWARTKPPFWKFYHS